MKVVLVVATALLCLALTAAWRRPDDQESQGIKVRFAEGTVHGFLTLSTPAGQHLANGDLLQVPRRDHLEARMLFHFADGSEFEETVTFTQKDVFALRSYRLVQRGPAFPFDLDATLDRNGDYRIVAKDRDDGDVTRDSGKLELPPDVYNGLIIIGAKNVEANATTSVHLVAFTPKPRLIRLEYHPAGTQPLMFGKHRVPALRFRLEPEIGAVTEFFAQLIGKKPPDSYAWITTEMPTFVRFEAPLFMGPIWRIDLTTPRWP
jgi:hypothetical protein